MKKFLAVVGMFTLLGFALAGCGGNQAPTLTAVTKDGTTFNSKKVTLEVKGEDKDLPQGQKLSYEWDFGDGKPKKTTTDPKIEYQYDKPGTYDVKVVAIDDKKAKSKELPIKGIKVQNAPPQAEAKSTPAQGPAPLTVQFDASASRDADGQITKYEWDFGDEQKGSGAKVEHKYEKPGTYTVTLTVTDNDNATARKTLTVTVEESSTMGVVEIQMLVTSDGKFVFEPAVVKVKPGDTIRWVCKSGCPHSATAYSQANGKAQGIPSGAPSWDSKLLSEGQTSEWKIPENAAQGSYPYFCIPHELLGQVGILVVGKYTDLSQEFLNSLQGAAKTTMQELAQKAKQL